MSTDSPGGASLPLRSAPRSPLSAVSADFGTRGTFLSSVEGTLPGSSSEVSRFAFLPAESLSPESGWSAPPSLEAVACSARTLLSERFVSSGSIDTV